MTKLILVGGFLVSGKTTLLKGAAKLEVGHVKILAEARGEQRTANRTNVYGEVLVPDRTPLRSTEATLILNARELIGRPEPTCRVTASVTPQ